MHDINVALNADLAKIASWMEENQLTLNTKKTKAMLFCSNHNLDKTDQLCLYLKNTQLENVTHCKYLGLTLDQTLKWDLHINNICLTVSKYIGLFYRIRRWLSVEHLNIVYKALVLPRLSYCDVVWGNCNQMLCDKVERLQNRAGRAILKVPVRTSSNLIRTKLGWKPLCDRRKDNLCITMFKCISGLVPEALQNYFSFIKNRHSHFTRGSAQGNIAVSFKPRTEAGRRSFLFRGVKAWNLISANVKCPLPVSTSSFKNKYYSNN